MELFPIVAGTIAVYMIGIFILSLHLQRNDIADTAWGIGFIIIVLACLYTTPKLSLNAILIYVFVAIWGLRLTGHILSRNLKKSEDYRYKKWRTEWGKWFYLRSFIQIYLLQGVFMFIICMPIIFVSLEKMQQPFNVFNWTGLGILGIGYFFEIVADWQLKQFKKYPENKGNLLQTGLWRYSRHPNYFGESCIWWGIWFISYHSYDDLISMMSPFTITYLLLFVSGVPMLEEKMINHPDFPSYRQRTNKFFPWFSK